jgi:zinc metalloprotease ZmpB
MPLDLSGVDVERDANGVVRSLEHLRTPYRSRAAAITLEALADEYLLEVAPLYGLAEVGPESERRLGDEGGATRIAGLLQAAVQPSPGGSGVVSYNQTVSGLPVWESGVAVTVLANPLRAVGSRSTYHGPITVANPKLLQAKPPELTRARLAQALGVPERQRDLAVEGTRLLVYRYDRGRAPRPTPPEIGVAGPEPGPTLPLPPAPDRIRQGAHYVVIEALFALPVEPYGELNWRAFIEPVTNAVLLLEAARADCTGMVYLTDPPSGTGNATTTPSSPATTLDPLRSSVTLHGLTSADPQGLSGSFVKVAAKGTTAAPPTVPASSCDFGGTSYSVASSNFAAVNCYYHLDELYRLMVTWGFDPITTLFPQTTFPVTAYYLDEAPTVNAHANGNAGFTALTNYTFGSEASGSTVGIAVDWRIVMHEFNHHILYDRVHSPNYGFAHNGGDAFAAVYLDPDSTAPDKGRTFPWSSLITRRNDRPVSDWAWGGTHDDKQYDSEEILTTCLMRAYQSLGGGATAPSTRRLAANHVVYAKVHADALLGPSPIAPTATAVPYVTALANADAAIASFQGVPGGTIGKVVRWAFELQGLFQPAGAPTPVATRGAAPAVDVYIDDGRGGEYPYIDDFWDNTNVWSRRAADGGTTHQEPVVRRANYAYVRVRNRGTQTATGVVVRGYHCPPSSGLVWPDNWSAMNTAQLSAPDIPPGGTVVVGPFTWVPTELGHECMLMEASCPGDRSNIDLATNLPCAFGPVAHWRLIPFDNNLAQRNVVPVAAGGGASGLLASFKDRRFTANNPSDETVHIELEAILPSLLIERGWKVRFVNPPTPSFTLAPRASRDVRFELEGGAEFGPGEIERLGDHAIIRLRTLVDGAIVGGMSYALDPHLSRPPSPFPPRRRASRSGGLAEELLEGLEVRRREVRSVEITKVTLEIEFADCDDEHEEDEE